jgi:uncharacterized protein YlbG (UPF0298 family)
MLEINDIKSLEQVPDFSIYIYYLLIFSALVFLSIAGYFIYKYIKRDKNSLSRQYFSLLKNIDFSDSKKAAYEISKYGRLMAKSEREKQLINDIYNDLEEFKYKKSVTKSIPKSVKVKFETFMESLDVR